MRTLQRRFYTFAILLTLLIFLGLIVQYTYLNKTIMENREESMIKTIDYLNGQINSNLRYYNQYATVLAEYIETENWEDEEALEYMKRLVNNNSPIKQMFFGDINNKLIISSDWTPPEDYDLRDRVWYTKALKENGFVFVDVYLDATDDDFVFSISKPVYGKDGKLLGVVGADISMQDITNIVNDIGIKSLGYSFLVDGSGNILAHPGYDYSTNINSIGESLHKIMQEQLEGKIEMELDGVKGYLNYRFIENTDWTIANFMSVEEFSGSSSNIWRMFIITFLIALLIFVAFWYIQKKSFLMPVYKLNEDISQIDIERDYTYKIPIDVKDPFIIPRKTINRALVKIQEFIKQIEDDKEEINAQNEELEASYGQLVAMECELREQYDKLIKYDIELRQALEKNRAIIEALPDAILAINKEGIFTEAEVKRDSILYFEEGVIGKGIGDFFSEETTNIALNRIENVINTHKLETFEYVVETAEEILNYEIRMSRLNDTEVVVVARNISERKRLEEKLINLSYKDQLTGLYNRRFFEEELKNLDNEENLPLSVIMADMNGLKLINDSLGHAVGDDLLRSIGEVLKEGCRKEDIIARIGGDEFVVVLSRATEEQAVQIVSRLKEISKKKNCVKDELNMELSISYGIATKYAVDMEISQILKKAEDQMYAHKMLDGPSMRGKTVDTIMLALYEKNQREEMHSKRVSEISREMAMVLNVKEEKLKQIEKAGLLHDIGKIAINEMILDKPEKLSDEEWEEIKRHPEIGYRIINTVSGMEQIAKYILYHHERYDGKGYPKGLKGKDIPLVSRIIAIADAYDAMVSDRPYRKGLTREEIVEEFKRGAGTQFDPDLTKIFIQDILKKD